MYPDSISGKDCTIEIALDLFVYWAPLPLYPFTPFPQGLTLRSASGILEHISLSVAHHKQQMQLNLLFLIYTIKEYF